MHPEPFTQADVTARTEPLDPLDEGELRKLATVAGVARDHKGEFIEQVRAEIDHYRLVERARRQERPAAVAAAMREALKVCERLILGTMNMSEPTEAGIARAKKEIARTKRHALGHREAALTTALLSLARTLQTIACQFAPSLKDDPAQLRHWLEEALIVAGIARPGKNQKKAYFHRLMLKPEAIVAVLDEASHMRLPIISEKSAGRTASWPRAKRRSAISAYERYSIPGKGTAFCTLRGNLSIETMRYSSHIPVIKRRGALHGGGTHGNYPIFDAERSIGISDLERLSILSGNPQ